MSEFLISKRLTCRTTLRDTLNINTRMAFVYIVVSRLQSIYVGIIIKYDVKEQVNRLCLPVPVYELNNTTWTLDLLAAEAYSTIPIFIDEVGVLHMYTYFVHISVCLQYITIFLLYIDEFNFDCMKWNVGRARQS